MRRCHIKNIALCAALFFILFNAKGQCVKDSDYYSITYHGLDKNHINYATAISQSEVVTLSRHSTFSDYVTKFTSQGQVIWSNEYVPDYPLLYWWQYPWYSNTLMEGMATGKDSTCFVYGSATEHGTTLNGAGPPDHLAGLIMHLDKFGNVITGKYVGNWRTDYSVNSLVPLPNGNLIVYLRSHFFPYTSKVICINTDGNIIWGTPLQPNDLYKEVATANPVMKQLSNGIIVVANEMIRTLDDTLQYPFLPPIIVPAPLYYFHTFEIDGNNGQLLQEASYQCPPLANTNAPADFIPQIKSVTELPNGNISFMADMYIPKDNVVFYKQRVFSRAVVNFVTNADAYFLHLTTYQTQNGAAILQSARPTGSNGEQLVLTIDSSNQQPILCKIGANEQVQWSKSFSNELSSAALSGYAIEKQNNKGYFIFQTDPQLINFHLSITNAIGNNECTQLPATAIISEQIPWPWYANKVHFKEVPLDIDFGYFPFLFKIKAHPLTQTADCEYQNSCCADVIDSLHPHSISICENQSYTLPDNTIVKQAGTYYTTLKTTGGCDSISFYTVKVLKSPSHLTASPDTCLNGASSIQLRASEGYDTYWWNSIATDKFIYTVQSPGNYTVKVENSCGSKTDTIVVYDHCDFPIYFPSGFSPNGDHLNDVLTVPLLNKNKLHRLTIYNRWGQVVFSTTDPAAGWNGTIKGLPQPTGIYIYYLEMDGLAGQRFNQKGTVMLIR